MKFSSFFLIFNKKRNVALHFFLCGGGGGYSKCNGILKVDNGGGVCIHY